MQKTFLELVKNDSLCSPNSNFNILDDEKLDFLYDKLFDCGKKSIEFINSFTNEVTELPVYCNNRVCNQPGCKEHRGYLFKRNHREQISFLSDNIRAPKAWVFTGWLLPLEEISRSFLQEQMKRLNRLLSNFSTSAYSIHMEVKLYPIGHRNYGKAYIHFHVVAGGINKLKLVRRMWKRQIKFQTAICYDNVSNYVSKYASKTPVMEAAADMQRYHLLVYKLQMHRFSVRRGDLTPLGVKSPLIRMESLELEVYYCLKRDEFSNKSYHPFCENYIHRGKPPPISIDLFE